MAVTDRAMQAVFEALCARGLDPRELGVPTLRDDDALALLWTRAISRVRRRTLPLEVGLSLPLGAMGVVDYLAASSATIGAALTVTQSVFPLVAPGMHLAIDRLRGGRHRVAIVNQPPFAGQIESDSLVIGIVLARLRQFATRPFAPALIELSEPLTPSADRWRALLEASAVRFGRARAAIHLSTTDWSVPLRHADPRLLATLAALVGAEHRTADSLLVAVRSLATAQLPSLLALERAAPALGMSRRTLQRKLGERATTLSAIVDDVRRDRAEQWIERESLSLGELASQLGFAEPASLTRAWRRWFACTPTEHRARLRRSALDRSSIEGSASDDGARSTKPPSVGPARSSPRVPPARRAARPPR